MMNHKDFEKLLESCGCGGGTEKTEEIEMFMQNLAKIHEYSGYLLSVCESGLDSVEEWCEDKISKSAASLSDVKHYIEYRQSAYGAQTASVEMHGMPMIGQPSAQDGGSVQGMGDPGLNGDRLPAFTQFPEMTPVSSGYDSSYDEAEPSPEMGEPEMELEPEEETALVPADDYEEDPLDLLSTFML